MSGYFGSALASEGLTTEAASNQVRDEEGGSNWGPPVGSPVRSLLPAQPGVSLEHQDSVGPATAQGRTESRIPQASLSARDSTGSAPLCGTTETLSSRRESRRPRVLVGVTGSVAAIKVPALVHALLPFAEVCVMATPAALRFFSADQLPPSACPIHGDEDEWRAWRRLGDPVMHIELRRWADLLLLAPLSANSLAKLAQGLSDNLVTCVVRAWELGQKPALAAPAMNSAMWDNPFTARHLSVLEELHFTVIPPVSKQLACGDIGNGAMAAVDDIVTAVRLALEACGYF